MEKEENSNLDEMNLEGVESKTKRVVSISLEGWIKEGQDKLYERYKKN